jgi:hypothetical protein
VTLLEPGELLLSSGMHGALAPRARRTACRVRRPAGDLRASPRANSAGSSGSCVLTWSECEDEDACERADEDDEKESDEEADSVRANWRAGKGCWDGDKGASTTLSRLISRWPSAESASPTEAESRSIRSESVCAR